MYRTATRFLNAVGQVPDSAAAARVRSVTVTNLAVGPFDGVEKFLTPYTTGMIVLGGIVLGLCMGWVAIKMGTRAAASKKNEGGAIRDSIGMVVGVGMAAGVLGAALILVAVAIKFGETAGTVTAT